jgi:hypothetical protein
LLDRSIQRGYTNRIGQLRLLYGAILVYDILIIVSPAAAHSVYYNETNRGLNRIDRDAIERAALVPYAP